MNDALRFPLWRKRLVLPLLLLAVTAAFAVQTERTPAGRRVARAVYRKVTGGQARFTEQVSVREFQRGSLHAHSKRSDGKATIEQMVAWYRDHGYQFAAMTEHNKRVDPDELASMQNNHFVLIPGEEVTNSSRGSPIHVNALCARATVGGGVDFNDPAEALLRVFEQVRAHDGLPLLNHPNYGWALDADDIANGARGYYLFEVWSAHPEVNTAGDAEHPSAEAIWDAVLSRGANAAPAAVDDAHQIVDNPGGGGSTPGRGWVETFGGETSRAAICQALGAGRLYASNGPRLTSLTIEGDSFTVGVDDPSAAVAFLGESGETLPASPPFAVASSGREHLFRYRLHGGETLVRARVLAQDSRRAWTPAYRVAAP